MYYCDICETVKVDDSSNCKEGHSVRKIGEGVTLLGN